MDKAKRISCIMNNMKEKNEMINYYKEFLENAKKAENSWFLTLSGHATEETFMEAFKVKNINIRIDGDLQKRVLKTMENYYQEKIHNYMNDLKELQETLKSL